MDTVDIPHYLCISGLLKARPVTEGARRFLFMEASNEATDLQGEKVLAKSLADSADYFLRYGNIDLDHRTLIPPRPGENPYLWEIGQPIEARIDGDRTFVNHDFAVGNQHRYAFYELPLPPGTHRIELSSDSGAIAIT